MPDGPPAESSTTDEQAKLDAETKRAKKKAKWRRRRRVLGTLFLLLLVAAVVGRIYLGSWVTTYVNHVIDQNKLYDGKVDQVEIHLWKGEYSIHKVRLLKRTGNVSAPFFDCQRLDIAVDWNTLLHGKVKAKVFVETPEINFVQGPTEGDSQSGSVGGGGPWLGILRDLAPFEINSAEVHNGSVHFKAYHREPVVDIYMDQLMVQVKNLTNVEKMSNPLNARVDVTGRAMDSGKFECHVKLNPFSYKPTFDLALRLDSLDVSKLNPFTKAYGDFDFETGYFDLVVELTAKNGLLDGYVKPLFRNMRIFGRNDFKGNIFNAFWQALLGVGNLAMQNQPRDQFATRIPLTGQFDKPQPDIVPTVLNVLRNAFIRAYLPRLEGNTADIGGLEFRPGEITDPAAASSTNAR